MSTPAPSTRPRVGRWLLRGLLALVVIYALLLIPEPQPPPPKGAGKQAFLWNRDAFWKQLETRLREARSLDEAARRVRFAAAWEEVHRALDRIAATNLPPEAPEFDAVEATFFELAPIAAVCPERTPEMLSAAGRLRHLVKVQSQRWSDMPAARQRLYRLLYGSRAAVEEVLLQSPGNTNVLEHAPGEILDRTPAAEILGVQIHSGDLLVSRGGAATSALIARGNDFPGNFSHVALVQVDEKTRRVSVIESHIESGVGVRPLAAYLADTKLRLLVLRLRSDLPALIADPMLPHRAASLAGSNALARHIPYDFAMDYTRHDRQFCSEVATAAYEPFGIRLWMNLSHLSTPGVTAWLAALGVRHFATQEPSDLEYDPQLRVVAEWRDPGTLFQDHLDNAVIDVMLAGAERGDRLDYNLWMLPPARLAKAWSVLLNYFGQVGPIPEGMSATTALRVDYLTRQHAARKALLEERVRMFRSQFGYTPPYWELVRLARETHRHLSKRGFRPAPILVSSRHAESLACQHGRTL